MWEKVEAARAEIGRPRQAWAQRAQQLLLPVEERDALLQRRPAPFRQALHEHASDPIGIALADPRELPAPALVLLARHLRPFGAVVELVLELGFQEWPLLLDD